VSEEIVEESAPAEESASDLDADLPEGDTFPREYVEKLRAESAKYRTRAREIESKFDGYTPEEKTRYLELVSQLRDDPEGAYDEFVGVTQRLAAQLGKEETMSEEVPVPPVVETEPAPPAPAPAGITEDDITRIVAERLAAEKAEVDQQSEVQRTFEKAEALDDAYKTKAGKAHLFAVAQEMNDGQGGTLEEAHALIAGQLEDVIEAAITEYREGIRTGKKHPPRLPSGDPTTGGEPKGPPKDLAEAKARAEERFAAIYGD
jgi:hypothetical protein